MVTITTLVRGSSSFMAWVAASPSIFGILTSMRTRSGRRRRHCSSASCPSAASPTTSRSCSPASMLLMPERRRAWSSAMIRRAGFVPSSITIFLSRVRERHSYDDKGSCPLTAQDLERAAEQRDPLLHACDTDPLSRTTSANHLGPAEALSVIPHPQTNLPSQAPEAQVHACSISVLAHVRQRLQRGRKP